MHSMRTTILLFLTLMLAGFCGASDKPERMELDLGSGKKVFYNYKTKRYSLLTSDIRNATKDKSVCFIARLKIASFKSATFVEQFAQGLQYKYGKGVEITALSGNILWIAGKKSEDMGNSVFIVEAWSVMPNDLENAKANLAKLNINEAAKAANFYKLATSILDAKKYWKGESDDFLGKFESSAKMIFAQGLKRDKDLAQLNASIITTDKSLQSLLAQCGVVVENNKWMSAEAVKQKKATLAKLESSKKAKALEEAKKRDEQKAKALVTRQILKQRRLQITEGKNHAANIAQVDKMLAGTQTQDLCALIAVKNTAEDVALYALFEAAKNYKSSELPKVFAAGLSSIGPRVNTSAANLILICKPSGGAEILRKALAADSERAKIILIISSIKKIRGNSAVTSLIAIVADDKLASATRKYATSQLKRITGQELGVDSKAWNAWWNSNKDSFRRK